MREVEVRVKKMRQNNNWRSSPSAAASTSSRARRSGAGEAAGLSDLAIVNSCAVTSEATRQARQAIRRLKREQPERPVVVTGCAAQIEPAALRRHAGDRARPRQCREDAGPRPGPRSPAPTASACPTAADDKIAVGDIMAQTTLHARRTGRFAAHTRGFVQVQNGCDHRCTFCVIPFGRGNSRSLAMAEVVAQCRRLTGGRRARDRADRRRPHELRPRPAGEPTLGGWCRRSCAPCPSCRACASPRSTPSRSMTPCATLIATEARLMPHLHLSLQAGDDLILKRMKRRHSRDDAIRFCAEMRALRPDIVFGADLIAGFPTEDEAMFARSLDLVEECGLSFVHVFPYSPRPGTPAARMPQLPGEIVSERAARLRAAGEVRPPPATSPPASASHSQRPDRTRQHRPRRGFHAGALPPRCRTGRDRGSRGGSDGWPSSDRSLNPVRSVSPDRNSAEAGYLRSARWLVLPSPAQSASDRTDRYGATADREH
jgi:threonylcarbamoyladenosine tRNA methylthiotransferase MtaB